MIPNTHKDYYGDETRWFIGTVKSLNDPLELGRVKVRIFGVHSENSTDVPDGDLPWAQVLIPVTEGGSSGIGTNIGIKPQAQVWGIFLDGKNSQLPLVLGSVPRYERPINSSYFVDYSSIPDELQHASYLDNVDLRIPKSALETDKEFLSGSTNIERAFNFFLTQEGGGFTAEQACGILGNFYIESDGGRTGDLDTVRRSDPPENSFGIAQWNAAPSVARYQNLLQFAADRNLRWQSLYAQLLFTIKELNDHKEYYRYNELKRAKTPREACLIFEDRFENPKIKKQQKRIDAANQIFREMTG
tara:strand:- start:1487 stop:2392 length:906 start_codon:yes stop_codon:yes gene_type:complete